MKRITDLKLATQRMLEVKETKSQIHYSGLGVSLLLVILFLGACSTQKNGDVSPLRKEIEYSVNQMLDSTDFMRNEGFIVVNILDYDVDQFSFVMSYFYDRDDVIDDIKLYFMHRRQKILVKFGQGIEKRNRGVIMRELGNVSRFKNKERNEIDEFYQKRNVGIFTYTPPYFFVEFKDGERSCTITHGGAPPGTGIRD